MCKVRASTRDVRDVTKKAPEDQHVAVRGPQVTPKDLRTMETVTYYSRV